MFGWALAVLGFRGLCGFGGFAVLGFVGFVCLGVNWLFWGFVGFAGVDFGWFRLRFSGWCGVDIIQVTEVVCCESVVVGLSVGLMLAEVGGF